MLTIDAQVHAYERDHPQRPWVDVLTGPDEVTGDAMVNAMDAVGVDAALLVSPHTMYRYDASYAIDVHAAYPDRFALIKPVDPTDVGVADTIHEWAERAGSVAVRIMLVRGVSEDPEDPGIRRILQTAAEHAMPVNLLCWGRLEQVAKLAAQNPNTRLVIDHLGLQQPFSPPAPEQPFAALASVLNLATYDNIAIKITGACTLSHQSYPYSDIWEPLNRIFDAYGIDRCMWGTDWTRAVNLLTYQQGVDAFRTAPYLNADERTALMGGTLQQIYNWRPAA